MALVKPSGVRATTTKTGTTAYSSLVDVDAWRSFTEITDSDTVYVCAIAGDGTFESFLATKSGGASPVLARTTIISRTGGGTDPVDWDTNTPLTIYTTLPGEKLPLLDAANSWTADQTLTSTNKVKFGDGGQYVYSPVDGQVAIYANATSASFENGEVKIYKSDDGASRGPTLTYRRDSSTPAPSDILGGSAFHGKNDGGSWVEFAAIEGVISTNAAGNENGRIYMACIANGAREILADIASGAIYFHKNSPNSSLLVGKSSSSASTDGMEFTGKILYLTNTSGSAQLVINRKSTDGKFVSFQRDGSEQGSIGVTTGTVSLTGAVMSHPSDWGGDPWDGDLTGVVVCSAEGVLADDAKRHPRCTVSGRAGDPTVYGVVQGRLEWSLSDGTKLDALNVEAAGSGLIRVVGPVKRGDLLETSPVPGTAWAQADDLVRASTVAKAVQDSPDDGTVRLVPCTLMAG